MSIYTLKKVDYEHLIINCGLDQLEVDLKCLGVNLNNSYKPFSNKIFLDKLYIDYCQRDLWLEQYILSLKSLDVIIWSEASRVGNSQYIYHINKLGNFKYENKQPGYFKNVKEVVFNKSLVIDFLSPFGINHSASTRSDFYKLLFKNSYYKSYIIDYYNSIIKTLTFSLLSYENIIVAPGNTKKLILDFLKSELKITSNIKSYDIDDRGAKNTFSYL
jgi:hypothetical protein